MDSSAGPQDLPKSRMEPPSPRSPDHVLAVQEGLRREVARAGPGRMRAEALECGWGRRESSKKQPETLFFFFPFIYFEREHAQAGERQRERKRERIPSERHAQCRALCGAQTHKP